MSEVTMLIGELSRRTGVSTRLLRYYEEQELLLPYRDANGYRSYGDDAPERVERIRELIEAGLPTREIREVLPCTGPQGKGHCDHSRAILRGGLDRLDERIAELNRRRTLMEGQVDAALSRAE
jgi:DNA-binding transcriptional MerR regulator